MPSASFYRPNDRVIVRKYGLEYDATVTEVYRTRLRIMFTQRSGKLVYRTLSAFDVEHMVRLAK